MSHWPLVYVTPSRPRRRRTVPCRQFARKRPDMDDSLRFSSYPHVAGLFACWNAAGWSRGSCRCLLLRSRTLLRSRILARHKVAAPESFLLSMAQLDGDDLRIRRHPRSVAPQAEALPPPRTYAIVELWTVARPSDCSTPFGRPGRLANQPPWRRSSASEGAPTAAKARACSSARTAPTNARCRVGAWSLRLPMLPFASSRRATLSF